MTLYRAVWRWHFYAGIFVAPFMLILAITGAINLFGDEINDILHADKRFAVAAGSPVPLSQVAEGALSAFPDGVVTRIDSPTSPGRTYEVFLTPSHGEPVRVFVDPASGDALGSYVYSRTLVGVAYLLHGTLLMGNIGDAIVELAACWGLILTITGLYLWWPRGQLRIHQALLPQYGRDGRRFWKSLHASIGFWTAFLILFLILTGLPWATIWGGLFRQATNAAGIGYPDSVPTVSAPISTSLTVRDVVGSAAAPWTIEGMPSPQSATHAGHHAETKPGHAAGSAIGLDAVSRIIAGHSVSAPFRLSLPTDAKGVYSVFIFRPDRPESQRTLHIDQYSGNVIGDVRFQDYGIAAKVVELGVQLHLGNYFGRLNQLVMLVPCIGIVILSVTGPYMWWLRRPKGTFAAPQAISPSSMKAVALIILSMGLLFPLAGLSLVVVLIGDWICGKAMKRFAPA